jgi:hypothetical protein
MTPFEAVTGHVVTAAALVAASIYLVVRVWRAGSRVVDWGRSILETLRAIELLGEQITEHEARITRLEIRHSNREGGA